MPETHGRRRGALRGLLTGAGVDALLVTDLLNIRYLTGFTGSNAAVLLHAEGDGKTLFCTDGRYTTQAAAEVPDLETVVDRASAATLVARAAKDTRTYGRLGFESQHVSVETYEALKEQVPLERTPGLVEQLRVVKDEAEVEALRQACAAADRALDDLVAAGGLRPGRTELEIARDLENRMLVHGSEALSFASIIAAGAHSAIPHHQPTHAELKRGDFVKMDFGATVDGYHSDMTRTFVLGEPADWQREVYELVHTAQAAGVAAVVPGAEVSEVDAAARKVIADGATASTSRTAWATASACRSTRRPASPRRASVHWPPVWRSPSSPACTSRGAVACASRTRSSCGLGSPNSSP